MPKNITSTQSPETILADVKERYNKMLNLSQRVTDDYNSARRLDVEQIRNLLVQISIISFGAVGFSIPIVGSSSVVKNPLFFSIGLFFLSLSAIAGLWYTGFIIENSIIQSYKGYLKNKEEIDRSIVNEVFLMRNPDKIDTYLDRIGREADNLKKSVDLNFKRDKVLYLLLTLLTVGITCIFFSLFVIDLRIKI